MTEPIDVHKVFAEYFKGCESLAYALSSKLSDGNICIDIDEYKHELPELLSKQESKEYFREEYKIFWGNPEEFEKQCLAGGFVTHSIDEFKPFVIQGRKAYLHRYFQYETQIIESIKRLGDKFHIITGGPGTGKTYSVSTKLVEMFGKNINLKVALAAPTGKAATRMNEAIRDFAGDPKNNIESTIKDKLTGLKAQTIHRLLGYIPDSVFFKYNEKNLLPFDLVIIDECSMIDGPLMAKLLNAIGDTNLILMGDKDQLSAVEAGSVFGDLCKAEKTKWLTGKVEFKTDSWRFDKDKGIGKFSREVISGHIDDMGSYDNDDQLRIDPTYSASFFEQYAILYRDYIEITEIKDALKLLNKIRFLCVTRESVTEVNKKIQYFLSKNVDGFKPRTEGFYHNQPVIVTQNDYKLGIFNGDVGIIRKEIINGTESFYANFENSEGGIKKIPAGFLNNYETVFAMTVHKSQGSEFDHVVVILPEKSGQKLLTRELLYTAVTRAKAKKGSTKSDQPAIKVIIQAKTEDIESCVKIVVSRASGIENRLNNL